MTECLLFNTNKAVVSYIYIIVRKRYNFMRWCWWNKATTIFSSGGAWDFHCARRYFFRTFLSKYFFLMRRKVKMFFPIKWNRNTVFHKNNTLTTQIQQRNIFFSSRWQHKFLLSYNAKSIKKIWSARALTIFFPKKSQPPPDKKMVVA